ncbi:MAG: Ger(x)C family spore germination protein, partial [Firmicutes bacterium]|nr:Ger(x)C family spore germination protein [Bacillota bacterium]
IAALHRVQDQLSRRILLAQALALVFSTQVAKQGLGPHLDALGRNPDYRPTIRVYLTEGKGADILAVKVPDDPLPARHLSNLSTITQSLGLAPRVELHDLIRTMHTPGRAVTLPVVAPRSLPNGNTTLTVTGIGLFSRDTLVGVLRPPASSGYMWLAAHIGNRIMPVSGHGLATAVDLLVVSSGSRLQARWEGARVRSLEARVHADVRIMAVHGPELRPDKQHLDQVKAVAEDHICREVEQAIRRAQALQSDPFGFGERVHARMSRVDWQKLNWERAFRRMPVRVTATVRIRSGGMMLRPLQSRIRP